MGTSVLTPPAARKPRVRRRNEPRFPILLDGIPIIYEDEGNPQMGDANLHTVNIEILHIGYQVHLEETRPESQVFSNLNCYYADGPLHKRTRSKPYISADVMIVEPYELLPMDLVSYTIGEHGPAPRHATEVLSKRTARKFDLSKKLVIFAKLGIPEYILVDPTGRYLPQQLLLKRLRRDRTWNDVRDADGGVTSMFGFRVIFEPDGLVRVLDARTGRRYIRPREAEQQVRQAEQQRHEAEERARLLAAEIARLRSEKDRRIPNGKNGKRRRK